MKKILFVLLAVLVVAVSCTDRSVSETASVRFGRLEAKSTVSGEVASATSLYWKYKATKVSGITYGQTSDYVALGLGTGLNHTINGFAPGEWKFQLRGYLDSGYTKLIYESAETKATLTAGETSTVTFNVDIVDGSYGTLKTTNPASVLGSTAFTVTCEGIHSDTTTKLSSPNPTANTLKQGLWTLKYTFNDSATNAVLGTTDVTALIMNGATTTVTLTYEAQTGSFKASVNTPSIDDWTSVPVSYEVGDVITMGTYPSGNGNTSLVGQGITWKVLKVDSTNKRALVISENILEKRAFDNDSRVYSGSDIQTYLNGNFITNYGLSSVKFVNVDVTSSIETTTVGSGSDKVFLLSKTEAENTAYFADDDSRVANYNGRATAWWLRSPYEGIEEGVYYVYSDGDVDWYSYYYAFGVRPAFWYSY